MRYYIKRDLNEYGPYTLADLQRYVAQGNIVLTDLARSEGMTDWAPVSQILGTIAVPVAPPAAAGTLYSGAPAAAGTVYSGPPAAGPGYGAAPAYAAPAAMSGPTPPDFHWALVLLIAFVTCGLFNTVWLFVEAAFVKKIVPQSKGLLFLILGTAGVFVVQFVNVGLTIANRGEANPVIAVVALALILGCVVLDIVGIFTLRSDLETYYNSTENIGLRLSGVMTFFFAVYYFQHHFSRISKWKKTGQLEPQG
jgi:GYF domain 2